MCKVQMLRALVKQRLTAAAEEIFGLFERTIAEHEEELRRSKEENERQRELLAAVFQPQLRLHRADVQQLSLSREEVPPEQQDWSPILDQDPEPPHIKEEQEELWISQEGEQLRGLEEADITEFPFAPVPVKSEEDEEKPQSSQLYQSQTEQMETGADGEDCGGPGPARNSDPDTHLQPDTDDKTEDSSEPETEDSDDGWKETRDPHSGLNFKNDEVSKSGMTCSTDVKPFSCSECGKRFSCKGHLKRHMRTHTGGKPFSCLVCGRGFAQGRYLSQHMAVHSVEKRFSCSVCDKRFTWGYQLKRHTCVGPHSPQLHQNQTEQMETEADGEDCGGPGPARNYDPDTHLQPDTDDKTSDSSEPETEDSEETREPQSSLKSLKNTEIPLSDAGCNTDKKSVSCSVCGKTVVRKRNLKIHMRVHTGEKPFSCSVCGKKFTQNTHLHCHMKHHTGEKPFSCSVCGKTFARRDFVKTHMRLHTGEKPFSCSQCTKHFTLKIDAVKHMRTHTGEKPFNCSVCGKTFTQNSHLNRHKKHHTGEKPFSCSVCGKTFTQNSSLNRHKKHHTG